MSEPSLSSAIELAIQTEFPYGIQGASDSKVIRTWRLLGSWTEVRQIEELADLTPSVVREFVEEVAIRDGRTRRPSASTMRNRRAAIRRLTKAFRSLGIDDRAPAADLKLASRQDFPPRPLTDDEMAACQATSTLSLFHTRLPALVALTQAGGTPREIAEMTIEDFDLIGAAVRFPGTQQIAERTNALTPWGTQALRERLEHLPHETDLLVMDRKTSPNSATASISGALKEVLNRSFIFETDVSPTHSIRAWGAQRVFVQSRDISAAARWLGTPSLDTAARTINWDWA